MTDALDTSQSATPATSGPDLSALVIGLLKGLLYQDSDAALWHALLQLQARVRDYIAVLGLELVLDEAEGYAFLRARPENEDESAPKLPRLVARRPLSFPVSLIVALLRKKLAEFDAAGGDTRLVLATRSCTRHTAVGCAVRHHGLLVDGAAGGDGTGLELHDAVLRVVGFTLLQGDASVQRALLALLAAATQDAPLRSSHVTLCSGELAAMQGYIAALQQWLAVGGRLVEGRSRLRLERALFVRMGEDGRVTEVLL